MSGIEETKDSIIIELASIMEKKKFLFISADNLINDIAWQVFKQGHSVKYCSEKKGEQDCSEGILPKVKNWRQYINWADVIIYDDFFGSGRKAEKLRKQGKKVIGGTSYSDRLEEDRAFGQEELKKAGIAILPYREFTDYQQAINYVKKYPAAYVIKPCDEVQNDKNLLFVGIDKKGHDIIQMLSNYRNSLGKKMKRFQLQRKVEGVEIAVGAFFNGYKFIYPININFEHKRLFSGEVGPATGEMGTSMFWSKPNKLFRQTLKKMESKLSQEGYTGYIDLNCIVNDQGVFPLEFTSRFGYPCISIQAEGIKMPISDFLYRLANGEDFQFRVKKGFQVGARIVVPPWPYRQKKIFDKYSKGAKIVFKKRDLSGIHIEDIKLYKGDWVLTGSAGAALIVVGTGATIKQAQKQLYRRINNIFIPNMFYRNDIGDRWYQDRIKLRRWGYLK